MIRVTAPGKLILVGEYAVLEGAPAIVAAVDRRVAVALEASDGLAREGTITIRTDLPGEDAVELAIAEDCGPDRYSRGACFVRAVARAALGAEREAEVLRTIGSIEVESGALRDGPGGAKLGLGSSAAVAAALTAGLGAWIAQSDPSAEPSAEPSDPDPVFHAAQAAHREAVGGSGSGVDVAASVLGGVHAFRRTPDGLEVSPLALPAGLRLILVWTGESADTAAFLRGIDVFAEADPGAHAASMARLGQVAEEARRACTDADGPAFLAAVDAYADGMRELGERARLPIVSAPHERVIAIARSMGAAAKPSGAGGGDTAVVFVPGDVDLEALEARLARDDLPAIRTSITPIGVRVANQTRLTS